MKFLSMAHISPSLDKKPSRFIGADIIRVLAMLMVIYLHTVYSFTVRSDFFATKSWFIFEPLAALSKTSMVLFFMLSGFLVINKNRTVKENWRITKNRIIVPLLFFTFTNIVLQVYKYKLPFVSGLWSQFLAALPKYPNNWLWFLMVLLFLYLLNPVWQTLFFKEKNPEIAIYVTKLFFIYTFITVSIKFAGNNLNFFNSFTSWLGYLFFYLYGALVRNNWINSSRKKINFFLILIGLSMIMVGDYCNLYVQKYSLKFIFAGYFTDYLSLPVVLLGIGIFNFLIAPDNQKSFKHFFHKKILKVLQVLAGLSYGTFLIHPLVVDTLSNILGINIDTLHINIYLYNTFYFLVVLGSGVLITYIIMKIPKLRVIIGG